MDSQTDCNTFFTSFVISRKIYLHYLDILFFNFCIETPEDHFLIEIRSVEKNKKEFIRRKLHLIKWRLNLTFSQPRHNTSVTSQLQVPAALFPKKETPQPV